MKVQKLHSIYTLIIGAFLLYGCTASEVTEEYEGDQQEVIYQTEKPQTSSPESIEKPTQDIGEVKVQQESNVSVTTRPEYIPQGPPTPPPPPIKVTPEPEQKSEPTQTFETRTSEYQYKVQVFAFKSRLNAESQAKKIRERMPDQQVYVEYEGNLYKVRLGIYSKWEHAKGIKDALFNLGYTDSFIITEVKQ